MKVKWGVEGPDGRHFDENGNIKNYLLDIPDSDFEDDMTEEDIKQVINEAVEEDQQYILSWWWEKVT